MKKNSKTAYRTRRIRRVDFEDLKLLIGKDLSLTKGISLKWSRVLVNKETGSIIGAIVIANNRLSKYVGGLKKLPTRSLRYVEHNYGSKEIIAYYKEDLDTFLPFLSRTYGELKGLILWTPEVTNI